VPSIIKNTISPVSLKPICHHGYYVSVIHYCEILKSLPRERQEARPEEFMGSSNPKFLLLEVGRVGKERREEVVFAC
jgi:hypothetical protein